MGRTAKPFLILVALLASAIGLAGSVPEVLIIQRQVEKTRSTDPNLEVGDYVAQELMDFGRVSPIYWSKNDAIFRSMVSSGKAPNTDNPSLETALEVAKSMKFAYVLVVEAHTDREGYVLSRAELYKGDAHAIWVDPSNSKDVNSVQPTKTVTQAEADKFNRQVDKANGDKLYNKSSVDSRGKLDAFNSLRSIGHTWALLLDTGPFGNLPSRPKQQPVDPIAGPLAHLEATKPQIPKVADNAQVFKNVDSALRDGHKDAAILILRDAVDSQPFELPLREALIKLLNETGHPDLAAAEAARAANLNPSSGGLRLENARSALAAGNLDAAAMAAKDALAHDPKVADAHVVLGEVNLLRLNYPAAITEFDAACAIASTVEAVYYRALAKTFAGDVPGAAADTEAAHHGSVVQLPPSYDATVSLLDSAIQSSFDGVRDLLPNVALGKNAADLTAALTKTQNVAAAAVAFLTSWPASKNHAPSHERRILALNLLAQACGEVVNYLAKRDEGILTDAQIDLGEAMKQYKSAKELFGGETAE
ncbi:MAG TPA: hypothetical protein VKT78_06000 [Fimbriimonadaceae bacterium]|nr:hypothetical protein [Fimbriimonadaceae bacterium]